MGVLRYLIKYGNVTASPSTIEVEVGYTIISGQLSYMVTCLVSTGHPNTDNDIVSGYSTVPRSTTG